MSIRRLALSLVLVVGRVVATGGSALAAGAHGQRGQAMPARRERPCVEEQGAVGHPLQRHRRERRLVRDRRQVAGALHAPELGRVQGTRRLVVHRHLRHRAPRRVHPQERRHRRVEPEAQALEPQPRGERRAPYDRPVTFDARRAGGVPRDRASPGRPRRAAAGARSASTRRRTGPGTQPREERALQGYLAERLERAGAAVRVWEPDVAALPGIR